MVLRRRSLAALLLLCCLFLALPYGFAAPETALEEAIAAQVATALRDTAAMGVHVVEVDTGETVYAYSPDEPRVIASNAKLFTTAAALDALGPGYFFETRLLARGDVEAGVLEGDLGVVGAGDPQISGREFAGDAYGAFRPWAAALRERGITRVTGDLYLANGLFEPLRVHPDWPKDQLTEWYEAPVDALSFTDNCILVRIWPGKAGHRAAVETVPSVPLFQVENRATTSSRRRGARLYVGRTGTTLTVKGSIDARSGPFETWVTVPDPTLFFGSGLRAALAEEGVQVQGRLRPVAELPGAVWERVAVHRSDLVTAVRTTNKRSQNFYAESLAKFLGWKVRGEGSWEAGLSVVGEFVSGLGVSADSFRLADGSGLSRANTMTPRAMTELLDRMYFHPLGREYVRSLPFSGEPGLRWQRRLARPPYAGNVFAKTGTIRGVSTLSGYAKAASGKVYAFSILCNQVKSTAAAQAAQDRIVSALIDRG
jgi:D-alanyl-D-alanine carboxypeptidase/D-alanyl-D-alanine-endopeptidase (penicillin-binding protein 4)